VSPVIKEKKYLALLVLVLFALFFLYAAIPLLLGISGAAILYVLLKPMYVGLEKKLHRKTTSALIVMVFSFAVIVVPLLAVMYFAATDIAAFFSDPVKVNEVVSALNFAPGSINLPELLEEHIESISSLAAEISVIALDIVIGLSVNLVVMYIIVFFLLTENKRASAAMQSLIPFNEKNSKKLASEFYSVINVTFIGNGAVAIVIGVLMAIGLYFAGAENIVFWALVSTIMAIVPIIGIQVIWIPAGIYYIFTGEYVTAAAIVIWGAFLSYILDGLVRQLVQSKIGSLHPFTSLMGLIVGVTYFGITGIIIGPLLISLFVLTAQMFREEYIPNWD
jgi:predicted PurR-regulated permease PerM